MYQELIFKTRDIGFLYFSIIIINVVIGLFITIDGIDGCGSTTHSKLLAGFLENKGYNVFLTREPTNSEIGKLLRIYLKNDKIPPETDALLFAADRSYHYLIDIKEKQEDGFIVISDRYKEASIVYQSVQSERISTKWIEEINKFAQDPDITIILDIDPAISLSRKTQKDLEKFENTPFLDKVREIYLERAKSQNYYVINSDDIIEFVQGKIQKLVLKHLKQKA
ncbi:MAG: dTMP kinase [Candidatus Lokiarchaeota archaeon]|nr:dTMP kinase [Candidatus Lokiarchaeota archaeon]MBD3200604.1 dTMP kinase [Candidatus Lokiarchaeota archaeon]